MTPDEERRWWPVPCVLLLGGCLALCAKSVGFEFLPTWDDDEFVLNNPLIPGINPDTLRGMFTNTVNTNYCPEHT